MYNHETKIDNRLSQGRGTGKGANYVLWLKIQDVPSDGRVSRVKGWKIGRIHHLMSQNELWYFYLLEWSSIVIDIREQYPLLPLERTVEIAESLSVDHPKDPSTKEPIVMTTDFMLTVHTQHGEALWARTIRPQSHLHKRELEKFQIEYEFYKEQGIDWGIVTDKDIPKVPARNIEMLHGSYDHSSLNIDTGDLNLIATQLLKALINTDFPISSELLNQDSIFGFKLGTCLVITKHMLAHKRWVTDIMTKELNFNERIEIIGATHIDEGRTAR